jgi:hypothetical protein
MIFWLYISIILHPSERLNNKSVVIVEDEGGGKVTDVGMLTDSQPIQTCKLIK